MCSMVTFCTHVPARPPTGYKTRRHSVTFCTHDGLDPAKAIPKLIGGLYGRPTAAKARLAGATPIGPES
jgi:hypothetical protein